MSVYYSDELVTLHHGDCLDVLRTLPDASVDAVVTDPPYGLSNTDPAHVADTVVRWVNGERDYLPPVKGGFMGQEWDSFVPPVAVWDECLRVLKPGGHVLAFAGSRTHDLMTLGIRLAGFDIRDSIAWLYGSGFPKSLDVSKAIDKRRDDRDAVREVCRWLRARIDEHQSHNVRSLAALFGFHPRMVEHWAARDTDSQPTLPTLDQWDALRGALGFADEMDAEVLRLNLRKGEPGEAWADRPVTGKVAEWDNRVNYALTSRDGLRRDSPATPDAERWQGWGTAIKPAFEPVVVGRKPLASPGVNVLSRVESELTKRGVQGGIRWTTRPASDAARLDLSTSSSSTGAPSTAGTSAAHVGASETPSDARPTDRSFATNTPHGERPIASTSGPTPDARRANSETKSSTPTAAPAPAAANESATSSPSTTSTEGEVPTARPPGGRSTSRSSAKDSPPATESFAGIATGLTGSWATVRIDRLEDGSFVWPDGLPRKTGGGGTVAANVLEHGTGALNIDGCRIEGEPTPVMARFAGDRPRDEYRTGTGARTGEMSSRGRWPTNVALDDTQADELDRQSGESTSQGGSRTASRGATQGASNGGMQGGYNLGAGGDYQPYGDSGGASRFFPTFRYEAKAPTSERPKVNGTAHPTVKPLDLMRWLVRLVTPPGGTVLEPFAGSGTTVEACVIEGFKCIAIEKTEEYLPLTVARINRQRNPVEAIRQAGDDLGLFEGLEGMGA